MSSDSKRWKNLDQWCLNLGLAFYMIIFFFCVYNWMEIYLNFFMWPLHYFKHKFVCKNERRKPAITLPHAFKSTKQHPHNKFLDLFLAPSKSLFYRENTSQSLMYIQYQNLNYERIFFSCLFSCPFLKDPRIIYNWYNTPCSDLFFMRWRSVLAQINGAINI